MIRLLKQLLLEWNSGDNQRLKLQQAYFVLALVTAVSAGLITLVNISIGQFAIMIAAFLALVYFTNAIAWALLDALVAKKLETPAPKPVASSKKR